ncbi:MAG TPA: DUF3617 family protein [Bryobacteraceae bacterium]|nr:DUF3617 family protein [Bryobacteraceae bacterium]
MSQIMEFPRMTKVVFATLLLSYAAAWAADVPLAVKTGLWESTSTMERSGAPPIPPEVLARIPPEQRAKMEERMKASQAPTTTTTKTCVTQEQLNKAFAMGDEQKSCTRTVTSASATKQEIQIECATVQFKSTGVIRVEAVNPENVKGSMQMNTTTPTGGKGMTINSTFSAKWLGPTCEAKK